MSDIKVLGAGAPLLDILVCVEDSFIDSIDGEKGGMELVSAELLESILAKTGKQPVIAAGGSAANTIFGLAKLGVATSLLGKLGNDTDGAIYSKQYASMGGDISSFCSMNELHNGRCLSLVTPDSERTMRTDLGAAAAITCEDITEDNFNGISHVHLEGYLIFNEPVTRRIMELAKQKNCTLSLDLASFEIVNATKPILPELLEYVDIVFANEEEAKAFCGSDDPKVALESLSKYCETIVIKLGKSGSIIKSGKEVVTVSAEVVEALDTTGAGDLWQAGFLYGFLRGKGIATAGSYGSILGAEVVQVMGAAIPDDTWKSIREKIC